MKPDYNEAVEKYKDTVYKIAYVQCPSRSDADDVFQDVFMKLFCCSVDFKDEEHLKAWLIRVTVNCCKILKRSAWHRKRTSLTETDAVSEFNGDTNDTAFTVISAVKKLPEKYSLAVFMYYYEDYSAAEIAKILKTNEKTVRTRLHRAREMLKKDLQEVWNDD